MTFIGRIVPLAALFLTALTLLACQRESDALKPEKDVGATATAMIAGKDGQRLGVVTLRQGPQGVLVSAELAGLPPGGHGFHIHAVGACAPDFSAAGGHFGPGEESHGFLHSTDMHAGDLPNLYANADGVARADTFTADVTLASNDVRSLFDADGSAIIVHANPDDYGEDSGVAGARIACGVIERD